MQNIIQKIANLVNNLHDFILLFFDDTNLTDKDLHFWVMGIIGILVFLVVLILSKIIASMRYGITILSFLYTLTFMFVLVFAIEIQQALTNRGQMEFQDAIVGLWGFLVFFLGFLAISAFFIMVRKLWNRTMNRK